MTVVVAPSGGLGNMLFQVAAGRELAASRGADLCVLPPSDRRDRERRPSLWAALGAEVPEAPAAVVSRIGRSAGWFGRRRIHRIDQKASRAFDPPRAIPTSASVVVLRGYFQHRGYFGEQPASMSGPLRSWSSSDDARVPGLVIHLRRGDYLPRGWQLPVSYYVRAVRVAIETAGSPGSAVVVGDDRLAAEGLAGRLAHEFDDWEFRVAPEQSLAADFGLLVAARCLVMSNSTFAWWGAVAGDAGGGPAAPRRIIAPAAWLGDGAEGLLPERWTRLPA